MTAEVTALLKEQLLTLRATVAQQLISLRGGNVGRAEASSEHFSASDDTRAQLNTEKDLEYALDDHDSAELTAIDAALARIAAGSYGQCLDCGTQIPTARLHAAPQASRCITCQQEHEQGMH